MASAASETSGGSEDASIPQAASRDSLGAGGSWDNVGSLHLSRSTESAVRKKQ